MSAKVHNEHIHVSNFSDSFDQKKVGIDERKTDSILSVILKTLYKIKLQANGWW